MKYLKRFNESKDQLGVGIKIEKEHRDLYLNLKKRLAENGMKMPMSEKEFYTFIAKKHLKEDEDYYNLLLKYIEK